MKSYEFQLPSGTKVNADPSVDSRYIFIVRHVGGTAEGFFFDPATSFAEGRFSFHDDNRNAVLEFLRRYKADNPDFG